MKCPSCGEYDTVDTLVVKCRDETGERMRFSVCSNCDYGINEHTEEVCDCAPERLSLAETVARAQNSSKTDPTWRTDYA